MVVVGEATLNVEPPLIYLVAAGSVLAMVAAGLVVFGCGLLLDWAFERLRGI